MSPLLSLLVYEWFDHGANILLSRIINYVKTDKRLGIT